MGEKIQRSGWWGPDFVSPFAYGEIPSDIIRPEIARLGRVPTRPTPTRHGSINLKEYTNSEGQSAYDRWQELHGIVTVGGKTLKQDLETLIRSSRYRKMDDVGIDGKSSPRRAEISKRVETFRQHAYMRLLKEFPLLKRNEDIALYNRRQRAQGKPERQLIEIIK